ncbi:MAG: hypothetical protein JWL63_3180 [Rhodocyclales bacterium]|nr:hypothetical protein [Rhodocyclales bacterium]
MSGARVSRAPDFYWGSFKLSLARYHLKLAGLCILLGLSACSQKPGNQGAVHLTSKLTSPIDILLEWTPASGDVAGYALDYATEPNGAYVTFQYLPADQTHFTHPRLMSQTSFYYRVRPIYGQVTGPLELRLSPQLSDAAYKAAFDKGEDYRWAVPRIEPRAPAALFPLTGKDADKAKPSDLNGTYMPVSVSGFQLSWTDHSSDEAGFLVEAKSDGDKSFVAQSVLPPNTNTTGFALGPPHRKTTVRVRAYYLGPASNLESKTTGDDPSP